MANISDITGLQGELDGKVNTSDVTDSLSETDPIKVASIIAVKNVNDSLEFIEQEVDNHNHNEQYAPIGHDHNDLYYSQPQTDAKLGDKIGNDLDTFTSFPKIVNAVTCTREEYEAMGEGRPANILYIYPLI
jgi:hypothetical protein